MAAGVTNHSKQFVDILIRNTVVRDLHTAITFQETQKLMAEVMFLLRCSEEQRHVECRTLRSHDCGSCLQQIDLGLFCERYMCSVDGVFKGMLDVVLLCEGEAS
jgi:hypothetical protein